MVWADAGAHALEVLDEVVIRTAAGDVTATVVVTPEQLLLPPPDVGGEVVEARSRPAADPDCAGLPGAEMPVLGATVQTRHGKGTITGVNAVHGIVVVTREDGSQVELAASVVKSAHDEVEPYDDASRS